jgi:hypothetical protein
MIPTDPASLKFKKAKFKNNTASTAKTGEYALEFVNGVLNTIAAGVATPTTLSTPVEIDAHEAASPTAAQLSAINATTIHNYSQAAADVNVTLPTPAANLGALVTVSTAQAANYWRFTCTGKIYLNGSATAKNYVQFAAPAVGNYFSFFTAKIADGSYAYYVSEGVGALSTN